jgi:hypothetical protein
MNSTANARFKEHLRIEMDRSLIETRRNANWRGGIAQDKLPLHALNALSDLRGLAVLMVAYFAEPILLTTGIRRTGRSPLTARMIPQIDY